MVDEITYTRNLNKQVWSLFFKRVGPPALICVGIALYARHMEQHHKARMNYFYNRSKLFGGMKNPQY